MWKYYPAVHKLFRESVETITFGFGSTMQDTVPKVPHDDCTNCVFSGIQLAQFSKLTRIEFSVGPYARNWTDNMVTFGHELRHLAGPCPLKSILLNWGRTQDDYHRPPHVQEGCVGLEREKWEVFDSEAARLKIWVSCNYLVFGGNVAAAKEVVRSTLRTCLVELNRTGYLSIR
ncbi:hypothetical protein DL96DRAFT_1623222 [Flagelloscypha sp. PMI_526]|nr:hypothetical protein DL96DRAFT_1623222 [Flagelloscypha sp. PMI_526]